MKSAASHRIMELDGLRAFAVGVVVLYHMSQYSGSLPKGPSYLFEVVTSLGFHGVAIFFIISGFIITRLLMREREKAGRSR